MTELRMGDMPRPTFVDAGYAVYVDMSKFLAELPQIEITVESRLTSGR